MYRTYVGVMGYQGGGDLHIKALQTLNIECKKVCKVEDFSNLRGLILPGGESSVQSNFLKIHNLEEAIIEFSSLKYPILGTCAGCILLSQYQSPKVRGLNLLDVEIERNFYGAQIVSDIKISDGNQEVLFIRAPGILKVGKEVEILDSYQQKPILIKQGNIYGATYHPEALCLDSNNIISKLFKNGVL